MADDEKEIIRAWIVKNVDDRDVPGDEGNPDALIYNLVHLLQEGRPYRMYEYQADQDAEIEQLKRKYPNA